MFYSYEHIRFVCWIMLLMYVYRKLKKNMFLFCAMNLLRNKWLSNTYNIQIHTHTRTNVCHLKWRRIWCTIECLIYESAKCWRLISDQKAIVLCAHCIYHTSVDAFRVRFVNYFIFPRAFIQVKYHFFYLFCTQCIYLKLRARTKMEIQSHLLGVRQPN